MAVTNWFTIYPNIECRFYSPELNKNFSFIPILRNSKFEPVGSNRIVIMGYVRGIYFSFISERIFFVCINRLAISLQLPAAGNIYFIPFCSIAFIISSLLSVFLIRQITTGLKRLNDAVLALELGDYDSKIEITSNDEIGRLASTFEKMRVSLKETIKLLYSEYHEIRLFALLSLVLKFQKGD